MKQNVPSDREAFPMRSGRASPRRIRSPPASWSLPQHSRKAPDCERVHEQTITIADRWQFPSIAGGIAPSCLFRAPGCLVDTARKTLQVAVPLTQTLEGRKGSKDAAL